jgi:hypothetical protein
VISHSALIENVRGFTSLLRGRGCHDAAVLPLGLQKTRGISPLAVLCTFSHTLGFYLNFLFNFGPVICRQRLKAGTPVIPTDNNKFLRSGSLDFEN